MNFFGLRRGRPPVGEFARARLRLTAWYAGLLLLLLGLIGGLAYALMTDRLDAQFDLGAAALIAGLTNVLTISSAAGTKLLTSVSR